MADEFAVLAFYLDTVKMLADLFYPVGIPNGNNCPGQFFGTEIEVINRPPVVNDKFRFGYSVQG